MIAMSDWRNSAPPKPTGMPNARNASQNESALSSQRPTDQTLTRRIRAGVRSTARPARKASTASTMGRRSLRGSTRATVRSNTLKACRGQTTIARSATPATANGAMKIRSSPPTWTPSTVAVPGKPGRAIEMTRNATIVSPSKSRSTATLPKEAATGIGCMRESANARANSPRRTGRMLLVMKPMVVAANLG